MLGWALHLCNSAADTFLPMPLLMQLVLPSPCLYVCVPDCVQTTCGTLSMLAC